MSLRSASCRAIRTQLLWQCTSSAFKGKGEVLAHGPPLSRQFSKKSKQKAPTDLVFVDYFCGIGMFACALHQNGYRCLGAFDCDRRAASIYQANFPDTKVHVADIRKVPKKIIPKRKTGMFMIWPVGFPWSVPPALAHLKPPAFHSDRGYHVKMHSRWCHLTLGKHLLTCNRPVQISHGPENKTETTRNES